MGQLTFKYRNFVIQIPKVKIGESLEFVFDVVSQSDQVQSLMIDYLLHFQKANGTLVPKTFKIAKKQLTGRKTITLSKKHPLRIMTTRKLYPGEHLVELQINGVSCGKQKFMLTNS